MYWLYHGSPGCMEYTPSYLYTKLFTAFEHHNNRVQKIYTLPVSACSWEKHILNRCLGAYFSHDSVHGDLVFKWVPAFIQEGGASVFDGINSHHSCRPSTAYTLYCSTDLEYKPYLNSHSSLLAEKWWKQL